MSTETQPQVDTEQAAREATGAHPYGRYLEEFEVGAIYKHWPAKTVTEADDHLFCLLTMNHHPLHINDVYATQSQQGRNVVVGPLVYSLAVGMTVSDVSGKAIANLATEELRHPAPVFHGDTLFCESEVLEVKPSRSKPDRGTVQGPHPRAQPGRPARGRVQAPRARPSARGRGGRRRGRSRLVARRVVEALVAAVPELAAMALVPREPLGPALEAAGQPGRLRGRLGLVGQRRRAGRERAGGDDGHGGRDRPAPMPAAAPAGGRGGGSGLSRTRNSTSSNRSGSMTPDRTASLVTIGTLRRATLIFVALRLGLSLW